MEQSEEIGRTASTSENPTNQPVLITSSAGPIVGPISQQPCPTCGAVPATGGAAGVAPGYVYAIGRIQPRFPRLSVEKEFAQVTLWSELPDISAAQLLLAVRGMRRQKAIVPPLLNAWSAHQFLLGRTKHFGCGFAALWPSSPPSCPLIRLTKPPDNTGPNFSVSGPIDKFFRAPMRTDIGGPGRRSSLPKSRHDQERVVFNRH